MKTNLSTEQIVKMSIDDQKKLLSNICADDVFEVADALGEKEITWMIGDEVECVIEYDDYIYTWIFPEDSDDAIATSFDIRCLNAKHYLSSDIDIDLINIRFDEIVDRPFKFNENGAVELMETDFTFSLIEGEIVYDDEKIGSLYFHRMVNDAEFYDACDSESGDLVQIADNICDDKADISYPFVDYDDEVLILDTIKIENEYRGKGIGQLIMSNLQDMMKSQFNIRTIFLLAGAFELNDEETRAEYTAQSDKLVGFYSRCGFTHIKNRVMYIN
jgi:GNAT superfamily N-acetyltransferase